MSFSQARRENSSFVCGAARAYLAAMEMENRNYRPLSSETFYALERQARVQRSRELGRFIVSLARKAAALFQAPHSGKEVFHA